MLQKEVLPARSTRSLWFEIWTIAAACFALGTCATSLLGCADVDIPTIGNYSACATDLVCTDGKWTFTGKVCVTSPDDAADLFETKGDEWLTAQGISCAFENIECEWTAEFCVAVLR